MKIYVGDVIKDAVFHKDQAIPLTRIAKALQLSRGGIYSILNKPEMELKYIVKLGKVLKRDFTKEIKGIRQEDLNLLEEPLESYGEDIDLKDQLLDLQAKYIFALEDNMRLRQELRELEKKYSEK